MKIKFIASFILASITVGCDSTELPSQSKSDAQKSMALQTDPALALWVGQYSGTVPCSGCLSHCEGCDGVALDLILRADHSFKLTRVKADPDSEAEVYEGQFAFFDAAKLSIQLVGLKERNIMQLGEGYSEIIDTQTLQPFLENADFQLQKIA